MKAIYGLVWPTGRETMKTKIGHILGSGLTTREMGSVNSTLSEEEPATWVIFLMINTMGAVNLLMKNTFTRESSSTDCLTVRALSDTKTVRSTRVHSNKVANLSADTRLLMAVFTRVCFAKTCLTVTASSIGQTE